MATGRRKDSDTDRRKDESTPDRPEIADTLRRFEVITGAGRRRRWSVDAKAAIVGESCEVGANVSEVARRHDVSPSLVFLWRRQARQANAPVMASRPEPVFVPLTIGNVEPEAERATSTIEIEVGDVRVRIMGRVELGAVRDVLLAVRAVRR